MPICDEARCLEPAVTRCSRCEFQQCADHTAGDGADCDDLCGGRMEAL